MRRLLRQPLLHFLAGGAVLFVLVRGPAAPAPATPDVVPIVVSAGDVERLRRAHTREAGLVATAADEAGLIERAIDDEVLYREALARGLDRDRSVRNWLVEQMHVLEPDAAADDDALLAKARALGLDRTDLVVRRMLVQKMRLLASREGEQPPTDADLATFWSRHADDYRLPERVTLWQVFVPDYADAEALLATLRRGGTPPAEGARRGQTFAAPPYLREQSPADLRRRFGPGAAERVAAAPIGAWSAPIGSAYGWHLVWVASRTPGTLPAIETVRGRLAERWLDEQRTQRFAATLRALRDRHPLQIESAAWHARSRS
ncbi:MAG: peptidyl-prolyl cis-trans isomerase [bacterium]|nr:peptidyl-prolyl cis-trans isomerase [bacterium]